MSASVLEGQGVSVFRTRAGATRAGPSQGAPIDRRPPVVAAVDGSEAGLDAARTGAQLARELDAPLVLAYVRQGPPSWLGEPYFQRRLDGEMDAARTALDEASALARLQRVHPDTEVLEGSAARRIREFANHRDALLLVLGPRRRRFKRSVSQRVARGSVKPVVLAGV